MTTSLSSSSEKINLLDLGEDALKAFVQDLGEPSYRVQQLIQWMHQHGVIDFDLMTNLSKKCREKLKAAADIRLPEIIIEKMASDGTMKWLLRLYDGNAIETVFIPERTRGTLCVSSQVGCALNCSFCSTGKEGFNRNLTMGEIIGQVWLARKRLLELKDWGRPKPVTNVVMMGMGEPLLNYAPVLSAMDLMLHDHAYGLSKYRVTLSTSGVLPAMEKLKGDSECALAVSLHAANDALRNELVPINKKYPLEKLMQLCREYYPRSSKRKITFEYVMLKGVNDTPKHAKELIRCVSNVPCKINLIPFNPFPQTRYETSDEEDVIAFADRLIASGLNTRIRRTRGEDIDGACGQLAGSIEDRTGRNARWQRTGRLVPAEPAS